MVDPTDDTTPADTDFAKGAAIELRNIKAYLQAYLSSQVFTIAFRVTALTTGTPGSITGSLYLFPTVLGQPPITVSATITRVSLATYTLTLTNVLFDTIPGLTIGAAVGISGLISGGGNVTSKRLDLANVNINQNSSTHVIVIDFVVNTSAPPNSFVDFAVNDILYLTITGNVKYPTFATVS